MAHRGLALVLLLALAGCAQSPAPAPVAAAGPVIEGWIIDERLAPVAEATVTLAGLGLSTPGDPDGHYRLQAPLGATLIVVLEAPGYLTVSRSLGAQAGEHAWLNVTLQRVPDAAPYHVVSSHAGTVRCGVVAVLAEDPSRPHEHQGVRCSQLLNDTSNQWAYTLPVNATGLVLEAAWSPQSDLAQALVLKAVATRSGEILAFVEGTSVLRTQLSSVKLAQEAAAGAPTLLITLEPGAGTGNHEHGAAGAFFEQAFDLYATAFFNGPVDPSYSITRP